MMKLKEIWRGFPFWFTADFNDYYVDTHNGSDCNDGSRKKPFATLSNAHSMRNVDHIYLISK